MKILTRSQTLEVEKAAEQRGMSGFRLMENAGAAAARLIRENFRLEGKRVAVLCGQGNNGGDGYVVARKLKESGAFVDIIQVLGVPLSIDARQMHQRALDVGLDSIHFYDDKVGCGDMIRRADYIIDAIFGTGFHGLPEPDAAAAIRVANLSPASVISLDIPSGMICDSGQIPGDCINAILTISFISLKPCHVLFPGANFCGRVEAVSIGIPNELITAQGSNITALYPEAALASLVKIPTDAHKGTRGTALIVAGSYGMAGAALLSGRAAIRSGVGLLRMAVPDCIYPMMQTGLPEAVFLPLPDTDEGTLSYTALEQLKEALSGVKAVLIGPGIKVNHNTEQLVLELIKISTVPIVIDADGINCLSRHINIIEQSVFPVILTPHPGELSRLLHVSISEIEKDRLNYARAFSKKYGVITVLKGAHTVIATRDQGIFVNMTGNAGMARAGSGDMLAGMIVSFLAQGMSPVDAVTAAVCLHGAAGDMAAKEQGQRGMTVSDMIDRLPQVLKL